MERVARAQVALAGDRLRVPRRWALSARSTIGRHKLFAAFVVLAVALRVLAAIAYWPALELHADSFDYIRLAQLLQPGWWHPSGYPLFLALLSFTGQIAVVTVLQHVMGIAMGVLVYALVLRLGARRWLAALAALPVLLDGYQVDLEQFILAETLTDLLLLAGLTVLLWREQVSAKRAATVGLLLAAAFLTRTTVAPVLVVAALYLLVRGVRWRGVRGVRRRGVRGVRRRGQRDVEGKAQRRAGWRPVLACCAVAGVVLVGYGAWYAATWGYFGYSQYTGVWLYGRVAQFAKCDYPLPHKLAQLCPKKPLGKRGDNPEFFADSKHSLIHSVPLGSGASGRAKRNSLGEQFAITVIEHQPLDYAKVALGDTWHYFTPGRWMTGDRIDMRRWIFPLPHFNEKAQNYHVVFANQGFNKKPIKASPDPALMGPLRTYQSIFYTPGPLLLACLIGALVVGVGLVRKRAVRRHARWAALVLAVSAVLVVLFPSMFAQFSYRYGLPLLVLLPPAGAAAADIGLDNLLGWRRRRLAPASGHGEVAPTAAVRLPALSRVGDGAAERPAELRENGDPENGDGAASDPQGPDLPETPT